MKKNLFARALALLGAACAALPLCGQTVSFSAQNLPTGSGPTMVIPLDVYGNGQLGLACANYSFEDRDIPFGAGGGNGLTLCVYANDGSGVLSSNATDIAGLEPLGLAAADVNGDGFPDLICAPVGDNALTILTNDGLGNFSIASAAVTGNSPDFVVAADFNGDGKPDLASANYGDGAISVLTNNGQGFFIIPTNIPVGPEPACLAAADLNGDGSVDLVSANIGNSTMTVLTNNGAGRFSISGTIQVKNGAPGWVIATDVNGDGRIDLVTANGGAIDVFTNDGKGNFTIKSTVSTGYSSGSVVAADFNGDGKIDLACPDNGNGIQGYVTILTNDGTGNFAAYVTTAVGLGSAVNYPNFVTAGDFNNDGNNDVVISCYGTATLTVLTQTGVPARPIVNIASPANGAAFKTNQTISVTATASSSHKITAVDYYVDGVHVASRGAAPYVYNFAAKLLTGGSHALQAIAMDSSGASGWSPEWQINIVGPTAAPTTPPPPPALTNGPSTNGLLLWLDSSDAATVETNGLGGVLAWLNKAPGADNALTFSGNNDNFSSAAYNTTPPTYIPGSNGVKVVSFDRTGYLDNLNFSAATPTDLTIFVLASVGSNPGNYVAFMAFNESQSTVDYQTGLNFDMGGAATSPLTRLNVEGAKGGGNGGFQFLNGSLNFNQYYLYEIDYGGGPANNDSLVSVFVDNAPEVSRNESSNPVNLGQCFIGSRNAGIGSVDEDLDGQIAAVLVYDHQLDTNDLAQTRGYLTNFFAQKTTTPVGPAPTVTINNPTNAESFTTNAAFTFKATPKAPTGKKITAVYFYLDNNTYLGGATTSPYQLQVDASAITLGGHTLKAVAVDNAGVSGSASVQITVNQPGASLINFDALNTTAGAVGGAPLTQYLASYGVTVSNVTVGTTMEAVNAAGLTGSVQATPSSLPNFFTQAGLNQPVSFTLGLAKPVRAFGFTRVGLSSQSGVVSHPAWTATALDTNGVEIASVSEPLILSEQSVPAQSFELTGDDIAAVRFDSDSQKTAAFSAVLLDDLFLDSHAVAALLSVGVSVASPPAGEFVAPASITITANVTNSLSSSFYVQFFAGSVPIGVVSSSPYQFTWTNVLPGTYSLRARVVSASGLAVRSGSVSVTVQPEPDSAEIDFDSLATSRAAVKGNAVRNYLAGFGVTVTNQTAGTSLTVDRSSRIAGGQAVAAATSPNIFTLTGSSGPAHFTLEFSNLLSRFGFTRPELLANPFVSHPQWRATALDAAGAVIAQVGEEEIDSSTNVGKAEFSLAAGGGPGIAAVQVDSDGSGLTTFNALVMDNFILTASETNFPPAVAITKPVSGRALAAPPSVEVTADAVDPRGIESVVFYANDAKIGTDKTSPYTIHWRQPAPGIYDLTAVATASDGLASTSAPSRVFILPSAALFGISSPPLSQTVSAGDLATFSVVASGTNLLTFQWLFNGNPIAGANAAAFTLNHPAEDGDAGSYSVIVSGAGQSITSPPALLAVIDPPKFAVQPAGQTVAPGANVTLAPLAAGVGPFTWQWLLNGSAIPGATNRDYFIQAAQALQSGNYQVVVGNSAASTVSAVAPVVVQATPIPFTNDDFASRASFNPLFGPVTESNTLATSQPGEPLHDGLPGGKSVWFTWRPNFTGTVSLTTEGSDFDTLLAVYTGTALNKLKVVAADDDSGGYFTSLVTFNVTSGTAYQIAVDGYEAAAGRVVLGFPGGTGYRVLNPSSGDSVPVIVKQPAGRVAGPGARVVLSVTAASATKVFYQWSFQGSPINGATNATFVIGQLEPANVGLYSVLAVNTAGSAQSEPADVEIAVNQDVAASATQSKFTGSAGASPAALAWELRPRGGGDTRGFSVSQVFSTVGAEAEQGEPSPCGQVVTAPQWFTYVAPGAGTLQVSADGSQFNTVLGVYTGTGASFSDLTEAGCGYTTNYLTNGQPSVTLDVPARGARYFILIGGYEGASGVAQLQIGSGQPPVFNSQPASQLITAGATATFKASASGSLPLTYQWQLNGENIPGANKPALVVKNAQDDAEGNYTVIVSNSIAVITSSPPAALTLQYSPAITAGPSNETVLLGQVARFSALTLGVNVKTNPLVYQWFFDGAPIPKADAATLSFHTRWTNNGGYFLLISNSYGAVTSAVVTLTVVDKVPPAIAIKSPGNNFVTSSNSVLLTGSASDAAGVALVQARLNGGPFQIANGATSWSILIDDLTNGANTIEAQSIDLSSNFSGLARRVVIYRPSAGANVELAGAVTYSGLFSPADGAARTNAGFFTATVNSRGARAFSGSILLDNTSHSFAGALDGSASAQAVISRASAPPITVRFSLDPALDTLTGEVSSAGWSSMLRAERSVFGSAAAGEFTLVAPQDGAVVGRLTVTNGIAGNVVVTGALADGASIFRSAPLSASQSLPLYAPIYSGQGAFLGWINLTNAASAPAGQALWIKPGNAAPAPVSVVK